MMAAAVADYAPRERHATQDEEIGRQRCRSSWSQNPDLLADIGRRRTGARPVLVGFAVETGERRRVGRLRSAKSSKKRR